MMRKSLLRGMSGVVAAALAIATSDLRAQAIPGPNPSPTSTSATVTVGGPLGSYSDVFVSILGGTDRMKLTLYYFATLPGNLQAPVGGVAINPNKPSLPNNNPTTVWLAGPNSTQLPGAPFAAGSELIFGLYVEPVAAFPSYWVWSGLGSRNLGSGVAMLNSYGPGNVVYQNGGVITMPGTPTGKETYGFETDYSKNIPTPFGDYNDFVFTVESRVVPEPSTYALMLAGLAGMAVAARKRRRA